jgi:hypothetical protein
MWGNVMIDLTDLLLHIVFYSGRTGNSSGARIKASGLGPLVYGGGKFVGKFTALRLLYDSVFHFFVFAFFLLSPLLQMFLLGFV